jgi:hypothetical protein
MDMVQIGVDLGPNPYGDFTLIPNILKKTFQKIESSSR